MVHDGIHYDRHKNVSLTVLVDIINYIIMQAYLSARTAV